jgi:hypothetical protein
LSLSTSRWVYESSFDSDPSRISFAFSILRCINLSPGLSVRHTLSNLTSAALLSTPSNFVSNESQEPQPLYHGHGYSRIAPPTRAGLDSSNQQKSRLSSVLGPFITFDSPRPRGPNYLPHGSDLVPMGLTASGENLHPDAVSSHLSRSHELPRQSCGTSIQHKAGASEFPGLLGELPSQLSVGCCNSFGHSYAKIPLFLPSQTPNRDPSQDTLSPQGSTLMHEGRRSAQGSPIHCIRQPQTDCPRSDSLHTSVLRQVETEVQLDVEREISLHDSTSLPARTFAATKPTLPLQWSDGPSTDARLSGESNHELPSYQSVGLTNALGERGNVTDEAIPTVIRQVQCDTELTPVRT